MQMDYQELFDILQDRFAQNMTRHMGIVWADVQARLEANADKLRSLYVMEQSGGEPDVIGWDVETGTVVFCDCSAESPSGRRSLCFDRKAWQSRKKNRPKNNVIDVAAEMGIELLTEAQYRALQELGEFDLKTSSWVQTPDDIRKRGGALFCDRRYGHVFVYHNGAHSYYGARGFRGLLNV